MLYQTFNANVNRLINVRKTGLTNGLNTTLYALEHKQSQPRMRFELEHLRDPDEAPLISLRMSDLMDSVSDYHSP